MEALAQSFVDWLPTRRSIRAYLPDAVPDALLHRVVQSARQAPSGANLQPGALIAVQGAVREQLSADLVRAFRAGEEEQEDYAYFPKPMPSVLRRRQVAAARALYGALGLERDNRAGRDGQFECNYRFFDAPVALVVTIDSQFGSGGYMDLGMTLYGLMLAAHAEGLSTCAIGAMASYPSLIRSHLKLDASHTIVCGMALGYADPAAPVNRTQTTRCELAEYFHTVG